MNDVIYFNGAFITKPAALIAADDCGFTTGIGVFDSLLADNGVPLHAADHYERLMHDALTVTGLTPALSFEQFQDICLRLLHENDLEQGHARIRSTITGGIVAAPLTPAQTPTLLISTKHCPAPEENAAPLTCAIIEDFPRITGCVLENCKRLDYSRSYAARRKAESLGAQEAILTNTDGNMACGATSNLFIEENGALITPPLSDGVLAGVTRKHIIAARHAREESISIARLHAAERIYLTNSFIEMRPVALL